jgi:hypothetical protein
VIVDVEATTTIRQAEVGAAKTMLDRTAKQFEVALVDQFHCGSIPRSSTSHPTISAEP